MSNHRFNGSLPGMAIGGVAGGVAVHSAKSSRTSNTSATAARRNATTTTTSSTTSSSMRTTSSSSSSSFSAPRSSTSARPASSSSTSTSGPGWPQMPPHLSSVTVGGNEASISIPAFRAESSMKLPCGDRIGDDELCYIVSSVLTELVRRNDALPTSTHKLTRFHASKAPGISIQQYLAR